MAKQADIVTLFEEFSGKMPDNDELGVEGAKLIAAKLGGTVEEIKKNYSGFGSETEKTIYAIYKTHEEKAGDGVLVGFLAANAGKPIYRTLHAFFLSIAQSRKARAGKAFEGIIRGFVKHAHTPFAHKRAITHNPHFLTP